MNDTPTPDQIARSYAAMGDSVWAINSAIDGSLAFFASDVERRAFIDRNVRHLEVMLTRSYWTDEDMAGVRAAISAGRAHLG